MAYDADDVLYLTEAVQAAAELSHDPRTQNAALIVKIEPHSKSNILGVNRFPHGIKVRPERLDPTVKLKYMEHAERSAIYAAARRGLSVEGGTMYCPWFACVECSRAIICAGISRVVGLRKPRLITPDRWQKTIAEADELLSEAGILTELLDVEVGVEILFDGQKIRL